MSECGRGGFIHRAVHIDHERDAGSDGLPRRKYGRHRRLMQLDRRVATSQRSLALVRNERRIPDANRLA